MDTPPVPPPQVDVITLSGRNMGGSALNVIGLNIKGRVTSTRYRVGSLLLPSARFSLGNNYWVTSFPSRGSLRTAPFLSFVVGAAPLPLRGLKTCFPCAAPRWEATLLTTCGVFPNWCTQKLGRLLRSHGRSSPLSLVRLVLFPPPRGLAGSTWCPLWKLGFRSAETPLAAVRTIWDLQSLSKPRLVHQVQLGPLILNFYLG